MSLLGSAWSKIKGVAGGLVTGGLAGGLAGLLSGIGGAAKKELKNLPARDQAAVAGGQAGIFAVENQGRLLMFGAIFVAAIILLPRLMRK